MIELMICEYDKCKKFLLDPIQMPCSSNICKEHVDQQIANKNNGDEFECLICKDQHKIPNDGFMISKIGKEIIESNLHLDKNRKQIADLVKILKDDVKQFEMILEDPTNFIYEKISSIRNKIDLERERLINEINTLSDKMIKKLNIYEDECKQNINKLKQQELSIISKDIQIVKEELRIPNIEKTNVDNLLKKTKQLVSDLNEKYSDYKNSLLMSKKCSFNSMKIKVDEKMFGELCFDIDNKLASAILTPNQSVDLINLCEFDPKAKFNLLYRATRDGFQAENFHAKCDGIPNTLTIIKSKGNSNIFGGFCKVTWEKPIESKFKNDPYAFIFSLINQSNKPLKVMVNNSAEAICCDPLSGPEFGNYDLKISNNSNENKDSKSNFGTSYINNQYPTNLIQALSLLAGSQYFTTEDIEVFQLNA